jgi:hypothetical protein
MLQTFKIVCVVIFMFSANMLFAQPDLPEMLIVTQNAQNKLSWNNQYDGVKSIAVQRSHDSERNFVTIGILNKPAKGNNSYTDERPLPGKNNYRLYILFAGDVEWYSNTYHVMMDSALIAKSLSEAIRSGITKANENLINKTTSSASTTTDFYYTPSAHIYTNPYTGHININLPDAMSKRYSIIFFNSDKQEVLRVSRVSKKILILDKFNFNNKGIYKFELYEGANLSETGYVTIY